jgi:dephospho-CoA kinase
MAGPEANKEGMIGVTGFIGSGKSMVSHFLARRLNCPHLDADLIARDLMAPGQPGWLAIKSYNAQYILADGQLDRVQLRHDVFSESSVKNAVDSLIHPLVRAEFLKMLEAVPGKRFVIEVPLLFEAGWDDLFEKVILVYAEKNVCLRRVMQRDGVGAKQAERSYQSQMEICEKINRSNHVIDNSGSWWNTQLQILHLVDILTC